MPPSEWPYKTPEGMSRALTARAILRSLADSQKHSLTIVGPQVQQSMQVSRSAILDGCMDLRDRSAIASISPEVVRITERGMTNLDKLNMRLLRSTRRGPMYSLPER